MAPEDKSLNLKNNNGYKFFVSLVGLLALISGVYAMVQPMNQRIDSLSNEIQSLREDIKESATTKQMFIEVETQFDGIKLRVSSLEEWQVWWNREMLSQNAVQNEKIQRLENEVKEIKGQ